MKSILRTRSNLFVHNSNNLTSLSKRSFRSDLLGTTSFSWKQKDDLAFLRAKEYASPRPGTIKVAVTGSSGNIGYALLVRLASGEMFGKNQRVQIHMYDVEPVINKVRGIAMELQDCAFPTLDGLLVTDDIERAFTDIDVALLVGSKPRLKGMERGDLLRDNGIIFQTQGKALNKYARSSVKVVVVGNPANTNCLILANNAPQIPITNFTAMTRLDHDRGLGQIAQKAKCNVSDIQHFCIWGNHSSTMFPDLNNATINGKSAFEALENVNPNENIKEWYQNTLIPTVAQRGAAIIAARGLSSAASAANACLNHARDWTVTSPNSDNWVSMAVCSNGEYGVTPGLIYSYPVIINETNDGDRNWKIVENLSINEFSQEKIKATEKELLQERDAVANLLPN